MREEKEQAQLGELAARDDDWFKPIGRERETLGQWLARTIAEGTSINITIGTEHTKGVEPETFSGIIAHFTGDKKQATEEVNKYSDGPGQMSSWTNGSRLDSGCTEARMAWRDLD